MTNLRLSSAHVLAAIAIFIALGGSALAISAQSVKSKHVRDNSLQGRDVRDGSLAGADVAPDSLTGDQINESTLKLATASGSPSGPAAGALTGDYPAPVLAPNAVGTQNVAADALTAADLAADSVNSSELATDSVTSQSVSAESLTTSDLGSNSVASSELEGSSVSSSEIATNSVFAGEIADGSLDGDDVGHESGTITFDPPALDASGIFSCAEMNLDAGVTEDLRADVILVSSSITGVTLTPVEASAPGRLSVDVCNTSPFNVNPPSAQLRWIAFDV